MSEETFNEPLPLSDVLITLQREISRVQEDSALVAPGRARALITDDLKFSIRFNFTPIAASDEGVPDDEATIDAILVDDEGAHEMTLEGRITPNVPVDDGDGEEESVRSGD